MRDSTTPSPVRPRVPSPLTPSDPPRSFRHLLGATAPVAIAAGTAAIALAHGAFSVDARSVAAIAVWWAIVLALMLGVWPRARPTRAVLAVAGALAALAAWTGLSLLWAPSAERALEEFDRVTLYLGAFAAVALMIRARRDAERWIDGLGAGLAIVAALALASRLFPGALTASDLPRLLPSAATRLSYPIGYWNGLAILVALAWPLLLRAATAGRTAVVRGLAVAPLPVTGATIYLSSSRGGAAVAVFACLVFLAMSARRLAATIALVVSGAGTAVAVEILASRPALVNGLHGRGGAAAAVLIALTCAATGLAGGAGARWLPASLRVPRSLAVAAGAVVVAAIAVVASQADLGRRLSAFKRPPEGAGATDPDFIRSHLFSGGGSGRWQFWSAAVDEFRAHPVLGGGAGSYEPWWAQHGTLSYFVRNAHSLWLETLGELGVVGLVLVAAPFAIGAVEALRRRRLAPTADRVVLAAALAAVAGFCLGAALDWIWQIPIVVGVAMVCLAVLTSPATAPAGTGQQATGRRYGAGVAAVVAGWLILCAQAVVLLGSVELDASRSATGHGDLRGALEHALDAQELEPWAASPRLQVALVRERRGELGAARGAIATAIRRDTSDWRLRVVAARVDAESGHIAAARAQLAAAKRLNPRSPLLRTADTR